MMMSEYKEWEKLAKGWQVQAESVHLSYKELEIISEARLDEAKQKLQQVERERDSTQARLDEAERLLRAVDKALGSAAKDVFGSIPDSLDRQGWYIRDEMIFNINQFLANQNTDKE